MTKKIYCNKCLLTRKIRFRCKIQNRKKYLIIIYGNEQLVAKEYILNQNFFHCRKKFSDKKKYWCQTFSNQTFIFFISKECYSFSLAMKYHLSQKAFLARNPFVEGQWLKLNFIASEKGNHKARRKYFTTKRSFKIESFRTNIN